MRVLVTGGAGFIGSIALDILASKGYEVVVFDSLENGYKKACQDYELVIGETQDAKFLQNILREKKIEAVVHFAAFIRVEESYKNPYKYFHNNVYGSLQILKAMTKVGVKKLVFSSTAGVYGSPETVPIKEGAEKRPENPYGESKLVIENMLSWFDKSHELKSVSLRYFNAAGAKLDGSKGEDHRPETHLIPNLIKAGMQDKEFVLYGDDYNTKDGTCIRDYIHVLDLASAHVLALDYLAEGKTDVFNAGTGKGYSNLEVVSMVEQVSGNKLKVKIGERRPGDADRLVADNKKIKSVLGWKPQYSDLKTIVKTAWLWHQKHPNGYVDK
jgi:UDP-glucose 4-epimerase